MTASLELVTRRDLRLRRSLDSEVVLAACVSVVMIMTPPPTAA
jgi:hypothetical protein